MFPPTVPVLIEANPAFTEEKIWSRKVTPHGYGQKPFMPDGRLDLDITFGDTTMNTPIYLKMDAKQDLLLSEGVCRQFGIVT